MINPQELRIGNRIFNGIVTEIRKDYFIFNDGFADWSSKGFANDTLLPIPITPEILDKIEGFFVDDMNYNPDKNNYCMCVYEETYLHIDSKTGVTRIGNYEHCAHLDDGTVTTTFYIQDTKYLYQLQNLIYSLSGEELTFKTTKHEQK